METQKLAAHSSLASLEYRGTVAEARSWIDKKTGKEAFALIVVHNFEDANGNPIPVRDLARHNAKDMSEANALKAAFTAPYKKGQKYLVTFPKPQEAVSAIAIVAINEPSAIAAVDALLS